jgi:hypothetical protein
MNKIDIAANVVMDLARQLPNELKKQLANEWQHLTDTEEQEESYLPDYTDLEGWDEPINLEEYALNFKAIKPLQDLWKDELPASELIKMLTK